MFDRGFAPWTANPGSPLSVAVVTETYPPEVNGVAMTLASLVDVPDRVCARAAAARRAALRADWKHVYDAYESVLFDVIKRAAAVSANAA